MTETHTRTYTREYWNEEGGERWARSHARLDELMEPYAELLLERAELGPGLRVVDVGCGAGAVTLAAARVCGPGRVHAVDISTPLLRLAQSLAEDAGLEVGFVEEDAAVWAPDRVVDRVLSRFGVMFFEDAPKAFRNLRSWLAPGGRMVALCWQAPEANTWMSEPVAILAACLGLPEEERGGPGPFSLADPAHLESLLTAAGFERVELEDLAVTARIDGDVDHACGFYLDWGPMARFYEKAEGPARSRIAAAIRSYVEERHDGEGIELVGRTWLVNAS